MRMLNAGGRPGFAGLETLWREQTPVVAQRKLERDRDHRVAMNLLLAQIAERELGLPAPAAYRLLEASRSDEAFHLVLEHSRRERTGHVSDGRMMWIWHAALHNCIQAIWFLMMELERRAASPAELYPARLRRVSAAWRARLCERPPVEQIYRAQFLTRRMLEEEAAKAREAIREDADQLRVVERIDDVGRGSEQIAHTYDALTRPLPLRRPPMSLDVLRTVLLEEFPWMDEAIDAVVADLSLRQRAGLRGVAFRPLLMVGPPGTGKTRFAQRLADLVKVGFGQVNAAGSADNRMLAGTARGWASAQPCLPLIVMKTTKAANPLILVDEVDKAQGSHNGDLRATLLTMLEPRNAKTWFDECLLADADLSQVNWVLTANTLKGIPAPLVSRVRVVRVEQPAPEHFDSILSGIRWDLAADLGLAPHDLPQWSPEVIAALREAFTAGASVRKLKAAATRALSVASPDVVLH